MFSCSRFAPLPLTNLLFPAETATRVGTNFAYAARDHCPKGCSMGINEKRAARLFYLMFALRATPIENIHIIFNKRNPRGTTFPRATRDYYLWMFSIIALR